VILAPDGTVLYGSPSGERLLGYEPGERVGCNAFELVHPEDAPRVAKAFEEVLARPGAAMHVTYRYRHRDGTWRTLASTGTCLTRDPAIGGIVVHSRDVTGTAPAERRYVAEPESGAAWIVRRVALHGRAESGMGNREQGTGT
jgi:PAS domain S-box-containing protein